MKKDLEDIRQNLRAGKYPNEAAVSVGIVQRILQALAWPLFDSQCVWPEYSMENGRVDFALCHPPGKPVAFIEVKQVGEGGGAERQLFEYAFHLGIPLAILTDGREWNFFLPAEQGQYSDRRVYKLDLIERDVEECIRRFTRYLQYSDVCSGKALQNARDDYRDVSKDRDIQEALPTAWSRLIAEEDEMLLELMADKVAEVCGYKPDPDTVAEFLRERVHLRPVASPPSNSKGLTKPEKPPPIDRVPSSIPGTNRGGSQVPVSTGFTHGGVFVPCRNARGVMIAVFTHLSKQDGNFLDRFASLPKHGRSRRYIAKIRSELYPNSPHLEDYSEQIGSSPYWIGTNVSRTHIEQIIKMACDVAKIRFGHDLIINLGK